MKLLVVGSGGREHAIAKKLLESKDVEQVFVAPGNDGMTLDGLDLINIGISEHSKLIDFAKANDIAWTFIGPDDALAAGIVDDFNAAGLKAFGPTKAAAELEWSKDFAKEIMVKYDVPTAAYGTFSDFEEAKAYIEEKGAPIVVKADGLALGKGVVDDLGQFGGVGGDGVVVPVPVGALHDHVVRPLEGDRVPNDGLVDVADVTGKYQLFGDISLCQPDFHTGGAAGAVYTVFGRDKATAGVCSAASADRRPS